MIDLKELLKPAHLSDGDRLRALWAKVMFIAIMDYVGSAPDTETKIEKKSRSDESWAWFFSDRDDIGSFLWICCAMNLHPHVVRDMLHRQSRHELKGIISKLWRYNNKRKPVGIEG